MRARAGETVLIPGSMGTASYVAEGLGNPEAFATCQHGADRAMSRTAARKSRIALPRDIPRTATVRATAPSTVLALDREPFVAAVTGRREAAAAAEDVIRGRLGA